MMVMFAKNPEALAVKTRLAEGVGKEKAVEIYEQLLTVLVEQLSGDDFVISVAGPHDYFTKRFPEVNIISQGEGDLGERMLSLFTERLQRHDEVVLIGSDCPDISRKDIREVQQLLQRHDVVLGPAEDGGYYLIAMKEAHDLFTGMTWSHEHVLEETLKRAKRLGLTVALLSVKKDVDTVEEYRYYQQRGLL